MKNVIKRKAMLGLPLTEQERAKFLLFYATDEEAKTFIKLEKKGHKI